MVAPEAYNYCALPLAGYACRPDRTAGRLHDEPESRHRTPFQRDRDRIIHASAFRRLKYKTQVFVYHEGDHYRTRLTHTLEVAQITRSLARALLVNEDLAEAIALAHDLGHTPFAHMGEHYLRQCMADLGGFEHNDQSLRIVTRLERKYPEWNGLNLTWETLEGIIKHNGPVLNSDGEAETLPPALKQLQGSMDMRLATHASLETQIAALSDDIAYNNHDVEDGLRAGLFALEDLEQVNLIARVLRDVRASYPALDERMLIREMVREMIGEMVEDVLEQTRLNLEKKGISGIEDIRCADNQLVTFSPQMREMVNELRVFLFNRMYRHYTVNRIWIKVERIVTELFDVFMRDYSVLHGDWQQAVEAVGGKSEKQARARIVCDYIAGMTDRYAIREHERLFDLYWDLR
jgi:dGTPase